MVGVPRQTHLPSIHFLRKDVTFADNGVAKTLGTIPAGSVILKAASGVNVSTVFNAGTTNTLNIGFSNSSTSDDDFWATLLALGSLSFVALDEPVSGYVSVDTDVTATVVLTGTAATTGVAQIWVAYIPNNGNNAP